MPTPPVPETPPEDSGRFTGDAEEGSAWTNAFMGAPLPDAPLTEDEKVGLNELMLQAKENGDEAGLDTLIQLSKDPAALRKVMASFKNEAKTPAG